SCTSTKRGTCDEMAEKRRFQQEKSRDMESAVAQGPNSMENLQPGLNRCLDAFIVALNQSCDGEKWYTSIAGLQLASLAFYVACRNVTTPCLTVDKGTPPRLWSGVVHDGNGQEPCTTSPEGPMTATRVPAFRVRKVMWKSTEPIDGIVLSSSLRRITFGRSFNQRIDRVLLPASVEEIVFGDAFNQPVNGVRWPTSLQKLVFGHAFNQPVDALVWPVSLHELVFGGDFNQSLHGVVLPTSLRRIELGGDFNQRID
ncbi:unnamed protein product, partial [Ectocarpus fasciculatus]